MHYRTTPVLSPGLGTLDDPAFWQDYEPCLSLCSRRTRLLWFVQGSSRAVPWGPYDFDANVV
jgi:hypothetical protein